MLNTVEEVRSEMDTFYESFLCILCDGRNHKYIDIK